MRLNQSFRIASLTVLRATGSGNPARPGVALSLARNRPATYSGAAYGHEAINDHVGGPWIPALRLGGYLTCRKGVDSRIV